MKIHHWYQQHQIISVHNTSVTSTRDHPSRGVFNIYNAQQNHDSTKTRLIFVNDPLGKRKYKYCDNSISTTQFTFK